MNAIELIKAVKELHDNCCDIDECPVCPFYSEEMGCLFDGTPNEWRVDDI